MGRPLPTCRFLLLPLLAFGVLSAETADPQAKSSVLRSASDASIQTRKDARAISLKIPAPRGMIVDRNGEPLAQNRVVYRASLQYQQFESADRAFIIQWGRSRIDALRAVLPDVAPISDEELFQHYRHRRWLPLYLSSELDDKAAALVAPKLPSGVVLTPIYSRYYPHGELAAHFIGYSGNVGKLPTGPINLNDPLWEESEGRAGLEKLFDKHLTGEPGIKRLIFDEHGNKLLEEQAKRPIPGGTLVTTLDLKWQLLAEKALREGCQRGAFVVIDAITGEVLVMASRPSFDLNTFIPGINEKKFRQLNEDPATPLYGRAFQSAYPPASTFKPIVAMAALNQGVVKADTLINCPVAISVGNAVFRNWAKEPEGEINVTRALARSCNTFFYQVALEMGHEPFLGLAHRLGYGQKTGLPLIGETPGILPNDQWMLQHEKRKILDGDTANMSIGQGSLLASPLQVAQGMAGMANGGILPKLSLIHQEQDLRGRVVRAVHPERRNSLEISPAAVMITQQGMSDVVNGPGGTGMAAQLSYAKLCGKTGTAQWGPPSKDQRLAWFAGFMPADNPRYAFAVLYEGKPGERVSGGRLAAPMVKKFFEGIKDDITESITPPKKALVVIDESQDAAPAAIIVDESQLDPSGVEHPSDEIPPLKALPVMPLEISSPPVPLEQILRDQESGEAPPQAVPVDPITAAPPARAIPVDPSVTPPARAVPVDANGFPSEEP